MSTEHEARATTDPRVDKIAPSMHPAHGEAHDIHDSGLPIRTVDQAREPAKDDSDDDSVAFHDAEAGDGQSVIKDGTSTQVKPTERDDDKSTNSHNQPPPSGDEAALQNSNGVDDQDNRGGEGVSAHEKSRVGLTVPNVSQEASPKQPGCTSEDGESANVGGSPKESSDLAASPIMKKSDRATGPAVSEWSHQKLAAKDQDTDDEEEVQWQAMPALGQFDVYDDIGRVVAKAEKFDDRSNGYVSMGAAGKGYTRVQLDEDAQSATSMDEDTSYLFKQDQKKTPQPDQDADDDDEEQRDATAQLENTKDLLTEGQRIAYVGLVRLAMHKMTKALEDIETTKATKKELAKALESMELWSQGTMIKLYAHMEIETAEQLMIEQLAQHGVQPSDLVPALMQNAKVKNPAADTKSPDDSPPDLAGKTGSTISQESTKHVKEVESGEEVPEVHGPEEIPRTESFDLDIRWTVLCDLFLLLITDSTYDARSRRLLERVASSLQIGWLQICRFEKRVIDALEGQESEMQETHDETDNMEKARKAALTRRYVTMGLATVGGGLIIGLSAGLLAPVIGAGLAAGFGVVGVSGTAGFLGGVGGAALITSIGVTTGGTIAVRASNRRTGHVKTFEYRPLHNNKRLNLILTVSGWMSGKVDDVRLPYSTVDPIMGDIYSLYWEPEMLQSMGDTINILATEALTQTVQQVLGSTLLITLMASLQLPIVLTKLAYFIDNPWSVSLDRANSAGLILADSLQQKHLGARPVTLIGFSLGARLIFACLKELSARGAYGLIQNVYLFGSPVVAKRDEYLAVRSVISGRFVSGYASNDWILGYLFRATSGGIGRVAGLAPVDNIPGLENIDVSKLVNGHMAYRAAMPRLLKEVGWEVESEEFTEIEDPDPENHQKRQRELINEIDEARRKAEEKPEKTRFGFFKRGRMAEKKEWEKYDASSLGHGRSPSNANGTGDTADLHVLFDIDAIRQRARE